MLSSGGLVYWGNIFWVFTQTMWSVTVLATSYPSPEYLSFYQQSPVWALPRDVTVRNWRWGPEPQPIRYNNTYNQEQGSTQTQEFDALRRQTSPWHARLGTGFYQDNEPRCVPSSYWLARPGIVWRCEKDVSCWLFSPRRRRSLGPGAGWLCWHEKE